MDDPVFLHTCKPVPVNSSNMCRKRDFLPFKILIYTPSERISWAQAMLYGSLHNQGYRFKVPDELIAHHIMWRRHTARQKTRSDPKREYSA